MCSSAYISHSISISQEGRQTRASRIMLNLSTMQRYGAYLSCEIPIYCDFIRT
jgi:hypothetical protein